MMKRVEARLSQRVFAPVLVLLLTIGPSVFAAQAEQPSYEKLLTDIRGLKKSGEFETQQELVQRNWKAGVLVNAFMRAPNAEIHELLVKLERDLGKGQRYFANVRDFARDYPAGPPDIDLPWTYFTVTASMTDAVQREALLRKALAEHWDTRRLDREAWKARFGEMKEALPALEAALGRPDTYQIILYDTHLSYNLGFDTFRALSPEEAAKFKEGDIVSCQPQASSLKLESKVCSLQPGAGSGESLFTRRAKILKILDGDTVIANIDLGFGVETLKKMRLRGIDAPEMDTEAGPKAKAHLETLLAQGDVLVRAQKIDKYNRALADLWAGEIYINRKMLDDGQAVVMQE